MSCNCIRICSMAELLFNTKQAQVWRCWLLQEVGDSTLNGLLHATPKTLPGLIKQPTLLSPAPGLNMLFHVDT